MKTVYLVSIGAIVLVAGAFLFSQEKETDIDRVTRQVDALRKEVSFLANQVELLKKDFAKLRSQGAAFPQGVPSNAIEREVNGVKYYIVPVAEDPAADAP